MDPRNRYCTVCLMTTTHNEGGTNDQGEPICECQKCGTVKIIAVVIPREAPRFKF